MYSSNISLSYFQFILELSQLTVSSTGLGSKLSHSQRLFELLLSHENRLKWIVAASLHCTLVAFNSFPSGGFTISLCSKQTGRKLVNPTSVRWANIGSLGNQLPIQKLNPTKAQHSKVSMTCNESYKGFKLALGMIQNLNSFFLFVGSALN